MVGKSRKHDNTEDGTRKVAGARKITPRSTPKAAQSRPRPAHCQICFAPILGGTYNALPIKLDPYPLTPLGELWSCFSGCETFLLSNGFLWRRNAYAVKTSPTGLGGCILRTHSCWNWYPTRECVKIMNNYDYDEPGF